MDKKNDEISAVVIRKTIANPLAKLLIKYTSITPNEITILSFFFMVSGCLFFILGGYINQIVGAFLCFIYAVLDHIDGDIARVKNMQSKMGQWMDCIVGFVSHPLILFSLTYSINTQLAWILGSLAMICYPMEYLIARFYKLDIEAINKPIRVSKSGKFEFIRRFYGSEIFFFILLGCILINKPILVLLFFALFGNLVWIFIIFLQYRNIKMKMD